MAPNHPIDFLFTAIPTVEETDCYLCADKIIPELHYWSILTTIPGKAQVMQNHTDCFEQLAWSMMNFVFKNQGELIPEGVIN